ncbi:MAG: tripartite tricarboxylate transporter TctB family protein [Azospirillaceae bacterium]
MLKVDVKTIVGGCVLFGLGTLVALYVWFQYDLGELRRMGPGQFPMLLGGILALLGALIAISGLISTSETATTVEWRPLLLIVLAVILFALTVNRLGLAPAIILMSIPAVQADSRMGIRGTLVLACLLALVASLLFVVALGMPLSIARWPF